MEDLVPRLVFGLGGIVSLALGLPCVLRPRRVLSLIVRHAGASSWASPGVELTYTFVFGIMMLLLGMVLLRVALVG